jgi:hypothetical protein
VEVLIDELPCVLDRQRVRRNGAAAEKERAVFVDVPGDAHKDLARGESDPEGEEHEDRREETAPRHQNNE